MPGSGSENKKRHSASSWSDGDTQNGSLSANSSPILTKINLQTLPSRREKDKDDSSVTTLGSTMSEATKERIRRLHGITRPTSQLTKQNLQTMKHVSLRPKEIIREYDSLSETTLGSKFSEVTKKKIRHIHGVTKKKSRRQSASPSSSQKKSADTWEDSQSTMLDPSVFSSEYISKRKTEKKSES